MPTTPADLYLRDHVRYTGDGLPNEPVGASLPVGDPASGVHNPKKIDLRAALNGNLDVAAASALAAAASAAQAHQANSPAAVTRYGGQLVALNEALGDPFHQRVALTLIGDSVTWGATLPGNATSTPRDQTLSDPRDVFATPSWANELKRWIGATFAPGVSPVLGNWSASASGESIARYDRTEGVFVTGSKFSITSTGGSLTNTVVYNTAYPYGAQRRLADGSAGTSQWRFSFQMTGNEFSLVFGSVATGCLNYTVWVNGVQVGGVFSTSLGDAGAPDATNRRHHAISMIYGGTVEIRTVQKAGGGAVQTLYLYGVEFRRNLVISNQGINGTSFRSYWNNNLVGAAYGDGIAIDSAVGFVIVQLGTNDRGKRTDTSYTLAENYDQAQALLDEIEVISPNVKTILMAANKTTDEDPVTLKCTMADIRGMVQRLAKANSIDFIDNYTPFDRSDLSSLLADGLHPNTAGHALMARNVISALRGA